MAVYLTGWGGTQLTGADGDELISLAPVGSQDDFVTRLASVLPARWFSDNSPVLTSVLCGLASAWASLYALLQFVIVESRLATATGVFLDMVSADYFGVALPRAGLGDASFRLAIMRRLLRQGGTRAGMASELAALTGTMPTLFEGWRPADTGGLNGGTIAIGYGAAGLWGSLAAMQVFIRTPSGGASSSDITATAHDMAPAGAGVWIAITD
jgi:hypothetical protein